MSARNKDIVQRLTYDLEDILRSMADHPIKYIAAIHDKGTRDELKQLVNDLRTLSEVIDNDMPAPIKKVRKS